MYVRIKLVAGFLLNPRRCKMKIAFPFLLGRHPSQENGWRYLISPRGPRNQMSRCVAVFWPPTILSARLCVHDGEVKSVSQCVTVTVGHQDETRRDSWDGTRGAALAGWETLSRCVMGSSRPELTQSPTQAPAQPPIQLLSPAFHPAVCPISNRHFGRLETIRNSLKTKARDEF